MRTDTNALPKYVQTSEMLIRDIASGRLKDGQRLPPEREMAADLGLAVGTLRKALAELEGKGLLERIQGSGNYIRHQAQAAGLYAFFRLELLEGGGLPTAHLVDVARLAKPEAVPAFGRSPEAHRIRRIRYLSGRPVAVEEIWLDAVWAETLRPERLSESLYLFYRRVLGLWIAAAEDRVGVEIPPDWARALNVLPEGPAGFVERRGETETGEMAEYSRTWFNPGVARYVSRMR
jgi:GntR family transcriptional regulator